MDNYMTVQPMGILSHQISYFIILFFFNDTATTEIYTLSLHDALPIWPTRPTPVTSATLPRKSGGTGDDLVDRRRASLREGDLPVPAHDVHAALDALAVVLERVIGARDHAVRIGQQRKIESQFPDIAGVGLHACGVHAERLHPRSLELRHLVAHGGELAVSAGCVVARIEDERDVFRLQHVRQRVGLAGG